MYDTASILRMITRMPQLEVLDGLKAHDDAMKNCGQTSTGDLTNVLKFLDWPIPTGSTADL